MKLSRLTLPLSLAVLLSGGLALPAISFAHDNDRGHRVERGHHAKGAKHDQRHRAGHKHRDNSWYLSRHRAARSYGYRPIKHGLRAHGKHPQHGRHQHNRKHHGYSYYVPARLHIGYKVVL